MNGRDDNGDDPIIEAAYEWIRRHPEVWDEVLDPVSPEEAQRLAAQVVERAVGGGTSRRRRSRRRRWVIGGTTAVVLVGGGVVAALLQREEPSAPNELVACRAEPARDADAVLVDGVENAIEACAEKWRSGELGTDGVVPELVACVSDTGVVEVYPGNVDTCAELELPVADLDLSPEAEAIVDLQDRLANEINLQPCRPTSEVVELAEQFLAESDLDGWTVTITPGWEDASCAKAGVEARTETVFVAG